MQGSKYTYLVTLYERLPDDVRDAVNQHNDLLLDSLKEADPALENKYYALCWDRGKITDITQAGVLIAWERFAKGCSIDAGTYLIPSDAIDDSTRDKAISEIVAAKVKHAVAVAKSTADRDRAEKRAQLERLKKELGE